MGSLKKTETNTGESLKYINKMLLTLFLLPLIGALFIFLSDFNTSIHNHYLSLGRIKQIALITTLLTFLWSLLLYRGFDSCSSFFQYRPFGSSSSENSLIQFKLGVDGLSLYFILLTTFTIPICILASVYFTRDNLNSSDNSPVLIIETRIKGNNDKDLEDKLPFSERIRTSSTKETPLFRREIKRSKIDIGITKEVKQYLIYFLILESLLLLVFIVQDILSFYIRFESVLIPLFLIVGIWGSSSRRIRARFLLFLYTLFGSLFILLAFISLYHLVGSTDFQVLQIRDLSFYRQKYLFLGIFLSFAIKTPLIPFHVWLSRAHVEAPLRGSIILRGVILKLRVYGFLRILIPIFPEATCYFSPIIQILRTISIIYASLTTLRQTDFKCLVAYSSVAHMGVVVLGLFSNTIQGIEGAILLSLAHGFVSPALFILVGGVLYSRFHTRVIRYYRGITLFMPLWSLFFFIFTIANIRTPLTRNWVGEFLCLTGIFQQNPYIRGIRAFTIVLSAIYSIWLYNRIRFGAYSPYFLPSGLDARDLTRREFHRLLTLLIPTLLFGLFPNIVLHDLHFVRSSLLYHFPTFF